MRFEVTDEEPIEGIPEEQSKEWDEEENREPKEELPSDSGGDSNPSPLWTEPMGGSTIHFTPTSSTSTVYYQDITSYSSPSRRSRGLRGFVERLRKFWDAGSRSFRS